MRLTRLIVAVGLALAAAPAQAQLLRSFVSGTGSDANNCTRTAPCLTFAFAITQTNAGGEIYALDPAGYGPVTITKSISIIGAAIGAGLTVPSGATGITISAQPTDIIVLRGLTIEGTGASSTSGIRFFTGASLTIEDCVIHHVTGDGIDFLPNATSSLLVSNTLVADNGSSGIAVVPTGSGTTVMAVFNRVEANNNGRYGIVVDGTSSIGTVKATVSDSVAARSGSTGFVAFSAAGRAPTALSLYHSVSANNAIGLGATGVGATLRAAQSMVTGNTTAGWFAASNGVIASYQDNYISGNGANTAGILTPIGKQ